MQNEGKANFTKRTEIPQFMLPVATAGQMTMEMEALVRPMKRFSDDFYEYEMNLQKYLRKNAQTANIPIVMLTARGHLAPLSELAETSVRSLLAKPFSPRNLLSKVNELLEIGETASDGDHHGAAAA